MKTLLIWFLSANQQKDDNLSSLTLFLRLFAALMMLPYGYGKIINFDSHTLDFFGDPIGIGILPSLVLTIFAQVACSIAIMVGFQTRLSSIILAFNMVIATKFHFADPFFDKALPLLFLGIYLILIVIGSGKYSLDFWIAKKMNLITDVLKLNRNDFYIIICMATAFLIFCFIFANSFFYTSLLLSLPLLIVAVSLLSTVFILNKK